jgi:hypothetical protein
MKKPLPSYEFLLLTLVFWSVYSRGAFGQGRAAAAAAAVADPGSVGFSLPTVGGTLQYAVNGSESMTIGYNGSNTNVHTTNFSGDLAYLSISRTHPFSLVYTAGYLIGDSNVPSSFYQTFATSQEFNVRRWNFLVADTFSYLPQTASTGLSGIPGAGDGSLGPITGTDSQGILTQQSGRINNSISGTASHPLTGKTGFHLTGADALLRYTGDSNGTAFNTNQETGGAGLSHRINALTSGNLNYSYSNYGYSYGNSTGAVGFTGTVPSNTVTQSLTIGYTRKFTRRFSADISLGPQRTSGSQLTKTTYGLSASVNASYINKVSNVSASYTSGTSNTSGVSSGGTIQALTTSYRRTFGHSWSGGGNAGYTRTSGLPTIGVPAFSTNTLVAGGQVNRSLFRHVSVFASYTVQRQSLQGTVASNIFNGISQTITAGLSYSPSILHLGHQ